MDVTGCIEILDLYIGFECALRQIKPDTIRSVYLQGIAKQCDMRRPVLTSSFRFGVRNFLPPTERRIPAQTGRKELPSYPYATVTPTFHG